MNLLLLLPLLAGEASAVSGPWNMDDLRRPPAVEWIQHSGRIRSLYYQGEPYHQKPTRVFAWFAVPEQRNGPVPAMVLVHGGGGRAFPQWATMWAQRGYAAIAMDLSGNGPDGKPLPDGGPQETDQVMFYEAMPVRDAWVYHAAAAVIRAVSFLEQQPEVDPHRIGITGISWGGFLTSLVAGLDQRLKVAIPVYGCGFIYQDSVWKTIFDHFPPDARNSWIENFDPSRYLPGARMPMLWINGTNDFAYPLDSYQGSYRLPRGPRWLRITIGMPHGHTQGWEPLEIGIAADHVLKGGAALPRIDSDSRDGNRVEVSFSSAIPVSTATLNYTLDGINWRDRGWESKPLNVMEHRVRATLPDSRPITYFVNLTDARGAIVSTEHHELLP